MNAPRRLAAGVPVQTGPGTRPRHPAAPAVRSSERGVVAPRKRRLGFDPPSRCPGRPSMQVVPSAAGPGHAPNRRAEIGPCPALRRAWPTLTCARPSTQLARPAALPRGRSVMFANDEMKGVSIDGIRTLPQQKSPTKVHQVLDAMRTGSVNSLVQFRVGRSAAPRGGGARLARGRASGLRAFWMSAAHAG